jgi:catechol 2,3-dioxygenase-like lactoylglutathione lyase family enzyme
LRKCCEAALKLRQNLWIAALFLMLVVFPGTSATPAFAQAAPPNAIGVTMGHWHLNSRDIEANKKILVAMGGTALKVRNFQIVKFPGVYVLLNLGPGAAPETGGTVGTVVNHVGFIVPNVQEAVAKWKAAGVPVSPGAPGRKDRAFVTTPDGLRIEILEDRTQTVPIRHDHIHFYVPQDQIPKIQAWYVKFFGAVPGMRGKNVAADIPGATLLFTKTDMPTVTTKGRVLDHIGFDVKNLDGFCKNLEAQGVKIERPYAKNANGTGGCYVSDPWGTLIELNERPQPLG